MIICLCHRVSDRDIAREVDRGCADFDELQERTRTGTGCGACLEFAQEHFESLAPAGARGSACAGAGSGCGCAGGRGACSGHACSDALRRAPAPAPDPLSAAA